MFEQDSFGEGVAPGGLRSNEEIRLLISYILSKIDRPVSRMKICDFLMEDDIANYFEINQAITDMIDSGALLCKIDDDGNDTISLMGEAQFGFSMIENLLPRSVREKAMKAATKIINRDRFQSNGAVSVDEVTGGYIVNFRIAEESDPIFAISVFTDDRAQMELMKRNFCDHASDIYSEVMTTLTIE